MGPPISSLDKDINPRTFEFEAHASKVSLLNISAVTTAMILSVWEEIALKEDVSLTRYKAPLSPKRLDPQPVVPNRVARRKHPRELTLL